MANIVQVEATNQVNASLGLVAYTATTAPVRIRLMTANGTATTAGTELASGGSYVAGTGQSLTAGLPAGATAGSVTNSVAAITFSNMPAATIVGIEIWDSTATPVRKWFGSITSKTTNAGDTLQFALSSVTISTS